MEQLYLSWSATTCDFPGAGLYLGLAPSGEHTSVAQRFSTRQLRVLTGGSVRVRNDGPNWPLNYFAVRDPSTVRVVPLDKPQLPNGFRHVKLHFQFGNAAAAGEEDGQRTLPEASPDASSAFLVTIGLPIPREEDFFREMVLGHAEQEWGEIYRRVRESARR